LGNRRDKEKTNFKQMNLNILRFETIESTNDEAIRQAKLGVAEGLCVVAQSQTHGRGRNGRIWASPMDSGLYFSIVLRPQFETKFVSLITLMSAIAVHETLRMTYNLSPDIKWVNDVHIHGKKISGILAEAFETEKGLAVIVGIGINLNSDNFPEEFSEIATSVKSETGSIADIEILLRNLTKIFLSLYEDFNPTEIREMWSDRSSYVYGKSVNVISQNETISGITRGIEENGALRIETENGEIVIVQTGEVEMLRPK
jgi:BirA family transcriptional regulator, biotin operon repressor / biotin---[acetyl-CoA-carboxylase] ligase